MTRRNPSSTTASPNRQGPQPVPQAALQISRRTVLAGLPSLTLSIPGPRAGFLPAPPRLRRVLQEMVRIDGAPGVRLLCYRRLSPLYEATVGDIASDAAVPVASASKWVAAALIMMIVEDGALDLDAPIQRALPFDAGPSRHVTLRQLLTFTSGRPGIESFTDVRQWPGLTLQESARQIASMPLEAMPGARFAYGSGALQIAGAMAEHVSGLSWGELFERRLRRPLGLTDSRWSHPLAFNRPRLLVRNPNLQGGLITSARDYATFLTFIADEGRWRGERLMRPESVRRMERLQTGSVPWNHGETAVGAQAVGEAPPSRSLDLSESPFHQGDGREEEQVQRGADHWRPA